jgi:hypothetical protein
MPTARKRSGLLDISEPTTGFSLFYVFLWVIIQYGQETDKNLPKTSRLRRWYAGSYEDIADIKGRHMDKTRFKGILDEFPPKLNGLKGLAEVLRRALFPIRDESLFTGTYRDPEKLYKPMIDAFSRVIAKHTEGEGDEKGSELRGADYYPPRFSLIRGNSCSLRSNAYSRSRAQHLPLKCLSGVSTFLVIGRLSNTLFSLESRSAKDQKRPQRGWLPMMKRSMLSKRREQPSA